MKWSLCLVAFLAMRVTEGAIIRSVDNIVNEITSDQGELWAVLVAGSNNWFNYRHQANVCHAYQILKKHGVPDDHIVVMMFDDISNNSLNPYPGVIINHPNGPNVYEGVPKDYTGPDVTPLNFLRILKGNAAAMAGIGSGKVINSTENDRIFINLVDHGGPGVFCFPEQVLHAKALARVIRNLHKQRKFKEMVIYVEACESGSLFEGLLPNSKVYAVTAANPHEPSFACYMDEELGTFLGDVFSIKWMEDTDKENINEETLNKQFHIVRKEVSTSHVKQWGERDISKEKLSRFLSEPNNYITNSIRYKENLSIKGASDVDLTELLMKTNVEANSSITDDPEDPCLTTAVSSPDVPVKILETRIRTSKDGSVKEKLNRELETLHITRLLVNVVMRTIVNKITGDEEKSVRILTDRSKKISQWKCYEHSVDIFHNECFNIGQNPYTTRMLYAIANLCEQGYTSEQFEAAVKEKCTFQPFTGIN